MSILREALDFYKERKRQEREKKLLLSSKTDIGMLENIIKRCNDNPRLKVRIFMTDGTRYELSTYEPKRDNPLYTQINGLSVEDIQ